MDRRTREDNPFEDEVVAKEWINSVEGERGMIREREFYPMLKRWIDGVPQGLIVDVGSGQGICSTLVGDKPYFGIEPSVHLVERANVKYRNNRRRFIVGNAYDLPLPYEVAQSAFSINVWFHLEDLNTASKELARILTRTGPFLICTANPDAYDIWLSMFENPHIDEKKIDGKVNVPINPLSRNLFFKHSEVGMLRSFARHGLVVQETIRNGFLPGNVKPLFVNYIGYKANET